MDFLKKTPYSFHLALIALAAFAVAICFFMPHFFLWEGLHIPAASIYAELHRAEDTLRQLSNPWVHIDTLANHVNNWRLFFPLLGHCLHLPEIVFLSLPHLGCFAALMLIAHIVYRETQNFSLAFVLATLAATASWFFVSTGWLAYFDSWLLLGLLIATFLKSTPLLMTTCFFMPWIDERFILTLPLGLFIRSMMFHEYDIRLFWRNCWICAIGIAPYLIARLTVFFLEDTSEINRYLQVNSLPISSVSFPYLFKGIWMGLRSIWILIGLFVWIALFQKKAAWTILTLVCLFTTFILNLSIAGDISRSMSTLLPAALAGFLLFYRQKAVWAKRLVIVLLVVNLLTPAFHVVTTFENRIYNLYQEIQIYQNPPVHLEAR